MLSPSQLSFLESAAQSSVLAERATQCPAALSLSQAILESGWGKAIVGNNCFGLKASDTHETYQITQEFLNGKWETCKLAFEAYDSLADCFLVHARLIQGGRYAPAWKQYQNDRDVDGLIKGIAGIYATDPKYAQEILALAHQSDVVAAIQKARNLPI